MSSAGVGPLCAMKSRVNVDIYREILEHFMLPSVDKLNGDVTVKAEGHHQSNLNFSNTSAAPKATMTHAKGATTKYLIILDSGRLIFMSIKSQSSK